jgi:hypothetical protein
MGVPPGAGTIKLFFAKLARLSATLPLLRQPNVSEQGSSLPLRSIALRMVFTTAIIALS